MEAVKCLMDAAISRHSVVLLTYTITFPSQTNCFCFGYTEINLL